MPGQRSEQERGRGKEEVGERDQERAQGSPARRPRRPGPRRAELSQPPKPLM